MCTFCNSHTCETANLFQLIFTEKDYKKAIVTVARIMIRIVWYLLINDKLFQDDTPLFKEVKIHGLPTKTTKMKIQEILNLLVRVTELIILQEDKVGGLVQVHT